LHKTGDNVMEDTGYRSFTWAGTVLIILGILLVLLPYLLRYVPSLEKFPPLVLYVYRRDGFYFATSPILIIISIISILTFIFSRYLK
jgi:hypothetical protein